ncbi:MAG: stage IV sporulation protein A [Clostridia bacterium]|nr:stage IV sporulation protein A [Clostridia bacterium]
MDEMAVYRDIANRTDGDIYIGVVGPVRVGKSTFIKRFMEKLVLPNIESPYTRDRAQDELPQSAAGKTIMTTEPKFIPEEAVEILVDRHARLNVRMIDCVGYVIPAAYGVMENEMPRMVRTPWSENELPFEQAAEIGTRKVINEHATIGVVITTDGSFGEIPRQEFEGAEERVVEELKKIGKPFAVVVNSADPHGEKACALAAQLKEKYGVAVLPLDCRGLESEDIACVLRAILYEFPVREIGFKLPCWFWALGEEHWYRRQVTETLKTCGERIHRIGDVSAAFEQEEEEVPVSLSVERVELGSGCAVVRVEAPSGMYYQLLGEVTGLEIRDEADLMRNMKEMAEMKEKYGRIAEAMEMLDESGYGIVSPSIEELSLEEPQIMQQNGAYGVRLRASAPSVHLIRANIQTEVSPIVGTEKQSEDLIRFLLDEFEEDPQKIWESNIFGKSLHELVSEGLNTKLNHMPEDARRKLADTLEKIINEGSNGLLCIIL